MLSGNDVIMSPVTPAPAFKIEKTLKTRCMYLTDIYTVSANLAGILISAFLVLLWMAYRLVYSLGSGLAGRQDTWVDMLLTVWRRNDL